MKKTRVIVLAGFIALCSTVQGWSATLKPGDKLYDQIKVLRDKWIEYEEAKDTSSLDKLFADDSVIGNSQGKVLDKQGFLDSMKNAERIIKVLNAREIQARVYGNTVIWAEHNTVEGTDKGVPFGGEFRFVRIFAKQNGKWRVVLAQGTRLPSPPK